MKTWRRMIWTTLMLVTLTALVVVSASAWVMGVDYDYVVSSSPLLFRVENHAGEEITTEGAVTLSGPFYRHGSIAQVHHYKVLNAEQRSDTYDFAHYKTSEYKRDLAYISVNGVTRFEYTYTFSKFGNTYVQPANGTFLSSSLAAGTTIVIKVDRKDVQLTLNLKNAAGQAVTSGVTVTVNGQSDSTYPYVFTNLQEGRSYDVTVQGSGYHCILNGDNRILIERNAQSSRSATINIGTAQFDVYAEVLVGGQRFSGAAVKNGAEALELKNDLHYTKLPVGSLTLSASATGVTIPSKTVSVTSAGFPATSPLVLEGTLNEPTVSGTSGTIAFGADCQLAVTNKVEGAVYTWTSSDPSVATVDQTGEVTPKALGSTNISVTCTFGTASKTKTIAITVEKGEGPMPLVLIGTYLNTNVQTETIYLLEDPKGAHKMTVTAVCSGPVAVNQTMTIENPTANTSYSMDFGVKLRGPVTYTIKFESNSYTFTEESQTLHVTYYHTPSFPRLVKNQYEYTGQPIQPELTGGNPDTYVLGGYVLEGINPYEPTYSAIVKSDVKPEDVKEVTVLQDHKVQGIIESIPFFYYDCPYALRVSGNEDNYYRGSGYLRFTIEPRKITVKAKDQTVPYATTDGLDTTAAALEVVSGSLLSGHTLTGSVAVDSGDSTKLNAVNVSVQSDPFDSKLSQRYAITTQSGILSTSQNQNTRVEISDGYRTTYTYGDTISAPTFTVSGAYESDVKMKWYDKTAETPEAAHQWSSGTPKNAGTYVVVAYTEENSNTVAASDSVEITIGKRTIKAQNAAAGKVYDGNGSIADPAVTFEGLQYGESLTENVDYILGETSLTAKNGTYDAGTGYTLTGAIELAETALAANYALESGFYTGTAAITRRDIADVAIASMPSKTYQGSAFTPDIAAVYNGMTLVKNVDYALTYEDNVEVGEATVTVTGEGNYTGSRSVSFAITQATPTVTTAPTAGAITYGQTLADSTLSGGAVSTEGAFVWSDDTAAPAVADSNTTAYTVIFHPEDTRNYTDASVTITVTVHPKSVTVTAAAKNKIFGSADPELEFTAETLVGDDQLSGTLSREDGEDVGTYAITQGTVTNENNPNYEITYVSALLTVQPKEVFAPSIELAESSCVYDQTEKMPHVTAVKDGDTVIPASEYTVEYSNNVNAGSDATVTILDAEGGNYIVSGSTTFTIARKAATVKALVQRYHVGTALPEQVEPGRDYVIDGLLEGDSIGTVTLEYQKDGEEVTPDVRQTGSYEIVPVITDPNPNYEITCIHGTLTFYRTPVYSPNLEQSIGGSYGVSDETPVRGQTIVITPQPEEGYEVDKVIVLDSNGNKVDVVENSDGTYSYVQPVGNVTIQVRFKLISCPSEEFSDLDTDAWYHEAVDYVLLEGLMNGVGGGKFDPNGSTNRAMLVTILWRLEGQPAVDYRMAYSDVPADTWYTEAVCWATAEGIVNGYGDTFGPADPITREQFATILWRYARYQGCDVSVGEDTNILSYEDAFEIQEWAIPAMQWACGAGLMQGDGASLMPAASATRVQAAALLMRFCELDP